MKKLRILVVDDDLTQATLLSEILERQGHRTFPFRSPSEAFTFLENRAVDLVITDLKMPDMDGLEFLRRLKESDSDQEVLLVTAFASVATAVEAMKLGARDYLEKPVQPLQLAARIQAVAERLALKAENRALRTQLTTAIPKSPLIGKSPAFQETLSQILRAAAGSAPILLCGETGTGKELFARLLHESGGQASGPFIPVNCGAIPENLVESEFFGHMKGAFTGADKMRTGKVEDADGGTLFLDEIGELPLALQPKLLRTLQSGEFSRLGSNRLQQSSVRWVAATNRSLPDMIQAGQFREDLYYRLAVIPIIIPPLRERIEDIPALLEHFMTRQAERYGLPVKNFAPVVLSILSRYSWPGNIRELENLVTRLLFLAPRRVILPADLPREVSGNPSESLFPGEPEVPENGLAGKVDDLERRYIQDALNKSGGNQSEAARSLGLTERTLRYKLKKFGIPTASEG